MAAIDATVIEELLTEVEALRTAIETAGREGQTKLKDINRSVLDALPLAGGKLDPKLWSDKAGAQKECYDRLVQLRDGLRAAAGFDGPADPSHIMHGDYASTRAIITATALSVVIMLGLLGSIVSGWNQATNTNFGAKVQAAQLALAVVDSVAALEREARMPPAAAAVSDGQGIVRLAENRTGATAAPPDSQRIGFLAEAHKDAQLKAAQASLDAMQEIRKRGGASEQVVLLFVVLLGALGGALHLTGSLVKYVGNRQLKRSWLLYYGSLPLVGAGLAAIVYLLLRVGILTPTGAGEAGSTTQNLNLIGIYAFAALTGMFATTATDKLRDVFSTIFRTERPSKDGIGGEKPGVAAAAAAPAVAVAPAPAPAPTPRPSLSDG